MPVLQRARHERFVREYVKNGGNGAEAYRKTWLAISGKPLKHPNSAAVIASRLLTYPSVRRRYREIQAQMAKRADITIEKVLTDYQWAIDAAKSQGKAGEVVQAASAQAKIVGLLRDRLETGNVGDFENLENISDIIAKVAEEAGPEAALALTKAFGLAEPEVPPAQQEQETERLETIKPLSEAVN